MQAIILAAGMGKRLGEYTKDNTKCMVPVNEIRLIDRVLTQLSELKLNRVIIVVGYKGKNLIEYLGDKYVDKLNIEFIDNSIYYKTNNIYSLALTKEKLIEDDTLLIESDLIFEKGLFNLLVQNPYPNLALVAKYESWMDGTMVCIDEDNNIVNFVPKAAFSYNESDSYYKTVNIYKFSKEFLLHKYVPFLEAYTSAVGNNEYYENVLRIISFLNSHELKALPISNEKWYEIDDKQDLDIAEALFADDGNIHGKFINREGGYWRFPKLIDSSALINPYFPSSKMVDEMKASFDTLLTNQSSCSKINILLSSKCWAIRESYIVPVNSFDLLLSLRRELNGKLGVILPAMEGLDRLYKENELVIYKPNNDVFSYDSKDIISFFNEYSINTLLLTNPSNPAGVVLSKDKLLDVVNWCKRKNIVLVLDESFIDLTTNPKLDSLLVDSVLEEYNNLIILKNVSECYGVPGLQFSVIASSNMVLINKIKENAGIRNLNSFSEYFLQILSKYEKDYKRSCERLREERLVFIEALKTVNYLRVIPSESSFILVEILKPYRFDDVAKKMLKEYNVLLKNVSDVVGLDKREFARISIKKHLENTKILNALKALE